MFEGTIRIDDTAEAGGAGELRTTCWPELVARLAAQRDLRGVLLERGNGSCASFNPDAAALLARQGEGIQDVNRDALSDRKHRKPQETGAAFGATIGDRETE